jgi:hypothetical protein
MPRRRRDEEDDDDDFDDRPSRRNRDPKPRGAFGTAFGLSSGCLLGVGAVVIGIPLLICGGCLGLGWLVKPKDTSPTVSQDQGPTKFGDSASVGSMRVKVLSAKVGKYTARNNLGKEFTSTDAALIVTIHISNTDSTKNGTASASGGLINSSASMKDNNGNKLSLQYLTGATRTTGQIEGTVEVRADKPVTDVLIFGQPAPGAKSLLLTLDAKKFGGKGEMVFEIPEDEWK